MKTKWTLKTVSFLLVVVMCVTMIPTIAFANESEETVINSASDFPTDIQRGEVYELGSNMTLTNGRQISNLAGSAIGMNSSKATQDGNNNWDNENEPVKKRPTTPVPIPEDINNITYITSADQLENMTFQEDGYYVLQNDITVEGYYFPMKDFQGVFDGQGHSVIFNKPLFSGLFANVSENGVIQNVSFKGEIGKDFGPLGVAFRGCVLNCYSEIQGKYGFAKRMEGGEFHNCYSVGGSVGAFVTANNTSSSANIGKIEHCYWLKELQMTTETGVAYLESLGKSEMEIKTLEFIALLNANRGEYGIKWGQSTTGYPYFGENQVYNPDVDIPELPENKYEVLFTHMGDGNTVEVHDSRLQVFQNAVNGFKQAGTFTIVDYQVPEGSSMEWGITEQKPDGTAAINVDTGELFIYKEGTAIVTATQSNADGTTETIATVFITSVAKTFEEIKLYVDGREVIDGKATVEGSREGRITVKAKYEGESGYEYISSSAFQFKASDSEALYHIEDSSVFQFLKPGTATITVTSREHASVNATVEITSTYVPVESVTPGIEGTFVLHGRNANSSGGRDFLPEYADVIVTPENASNRFAFEISSSNPEIGAYVPSMVKGYVPYKAGTTTYTAVIRDKNPLTGDVHTISGSKTVTYTYQNPLKNVSASDNVLELESGKNILANLVFTGTLDDYSISEPTLKWTYDKEGIVTISQGNGAWKREEGAPDNYLYFLSSEYAVKGLRPGTVIATGTPVDDTAGAEPVVLTITVKESGEKVDLTKLANDGIRHAAAYLDNIYSDSRACAYGAEWYVFTMLRAGRAIDSTWLNQYYNDVVEQLKKDKMSVTDMERVALALSAMEKDITNIEGVNLAAEIYNYKNLNYGSNALAFALLALDARDTKIPKDVLWSRETLVAEVLKFQNEAGFFGLSDNQTASIDMTAMVLQALAPYRNSDSNVNAAIEKALAYLKQEISDDFEYAGNSNSTAQVLLALAVLGENITSEGFGTENANLMTRLMEYQSESGFAYLMNQKANTMATIQIMQALDAYRMCQENKNYWDLTETNNTEEGERPGTDQPIEDKPIGEDKSSQQEKPTDKPLQQEQPAKQNKPAGEILAQSDKKEESTEHEPDVEVSQEDGWEFVGEDYEGTSQKKDQQVETKAASLAEGNALILYSALVCLVLGGIMVVIMKKKYGKDGK